MLGEAAVALFGVVFTAIFGGFVGLDVRLVMIIHSIFGAMALAIGGLIGGLISR